MQREKRRRKKRQMEEICTKCEIYTNEMQYKVMRSPTFEYHAARAFSPICEYQHDYFPRTRESKTH